MGWALANMIGTIPAKGWISFQMVDLRQFLKDILVAGP